MLLSLQSDFSFFFDTSGKRKCCLAPERFIETSGERAQRVSLTPEMDIFAMGCVIAELLSDGKSVFDYSELLVYKRTGELPGQFKDGIMEEFWPMVEHMLQRDPQQRFGAKQYVDMYCNKVACEGLRTVVHPLASQLVLETPIGRAKVLIDTYEESMRQLLGIQLFSCSTDKLSFSHKHSNDTCVASTPRSRVSKGMYTNSVVVSLSDIEENAKKLAIEAKNAVHHQPNSTSNNVDDVPRDVPEEQPHVALEHGGLLEEESGLVNIKDSRLENQDALKVLVTIHCALLRGCSHNRIKAALLHQIYLILKFCGDEVLVMNHVVPHLITSATDMHSDCRAKCLSIAMLPRALAMIDFAPNAVEGRIFFDYIFPSISLLPNDIEDAVKVEYSKIIGALGIHAVKCTTGQLQRGTIDARSIEKYHDGLKRIRGWIERGVHDVLVGASVAPKLSILPKLLDIAQGVGRKDTADGLLPALLTLFNSKEWEVRSTLYSSLGILAPSLGPRATSFILPFLDRMLADAEPTAISHAIDLLTSLASSEFMNRSEIIEVTKRLLSCKHHKHAAVRASLGHFVVLVAQVLGPVDSQALLAPLLSGHISSRAQKLDDPKLVSKSLLLGGTEIKEDSKDRRSPQFHAEYISNTLDVYICQNQPLDGKCGRTFSQLDSMIQCAMKKEGIETVKGENAAKLLLKYSKIKPKRTASNLVRYENRETVRVEESPVENKKAWRPQGVLVARMPCHSR